MTCQHCKEADNVFSRFFVWYELRTYRRKGAGKVTRQIIDSLSAFELSEKSVLDIGGGVGAIYHALFENGANHATHIDAAGNYLNAAREEANRRQIDQKVHFLEGDFVDLHGQIANFDIVTLDKVVCCYPDPEKLLGAAASHSNRYLVISFPKGKRWARIMISLVNRYRRLIGKSFQNFIFPENRIERIIQTNGFAITNKKHTPLWNTWVCEKSPV